MSQSRRNKKQNQQYCKCCKPSPTPKKKQQDHQNQVDWKSFWLGAFVLIIVEGCIFYVVTGG